MHSPGEELQDRGPYLALIEACYRLHPEAFAYYNRLADHIRQGTHHSRSIQPLKAFRLRPLASTPASSTSSRSPSFTYPSSLLLKPENLNGDASLPSSPQPRPQPHTQQWNTQPKVIVVEGFPSPWCITQLGEKWAIRPEFFIAHLPRSNPSDHFAHVSALPSLHDNLVRVHYTTMVSLLAPAPGCAGVSLERQRVCLNNLCLWQEKALVQERRYGETLLHRLNTHKPDLYSTEQMISLTVVQSSGHWNGKNKHALFNHSHG